MTNHSKEKPKISQDRLDELMRAVFQELKSRGGSGSPKDVLRGVGARIKLTPYEQESTEYFTSRGLVGERWDTHVRFWTTACARAGFLIKEGGIWTLTEAGEMALKMPPGQLIREAGRRYKESRSAVSSEELQDAVDAPPSYGEIARAFYDKAVEDARAGIDAQIDALDPYEFQNLVAELLRAMGYYIRHVSPPGADGGIDILAFRDPLGITPPHVKVQVKHRESKMDPKEVRELVGILHKDSDIGLLVSSGGFTREAEREIAQSSKHLDRIDRSRLIDLWTQHYDKLTERGRQYLPLMPVYFLAPAKD